MNIAMVLVGFRMDLTIGVYRGGLAWRWGLFDMWDNFLERKPFVRTVKLLIIRLEDVAYTKSSLSIIVIELVNRTLSPAQSVTLIF